MTPTFPLSLLFAVTISISAPAPAAPAFNQGIVIGSSAVIPSATTRLTSYNVGSWSASMLSDGFTTNSPEYIAVGIYFSQSPAPQTVWVGRQDLSAVTAVGGQSGSGAGTGYLASDVVTLVQGGGTGATALVNTVGGQGQILTVSLLTGGTGYQTQGVDVAVSGGSGNGGHVNLASLGETPLQAVTACRLASSAWYACMVIGAASGDHLAIAQYAQAVTPQMMYHGTTADAAVLAGTAGNVCSVLKGLSRNRSFMLYSTTQAGAAPNNVYASAATMGVAMGNNTGLENSYFTMKFKTLAGILVEPITTNQATILDTNGANVFVSYAGAYSFLQEGKVSSGQFYDEVLNLDMLASDSQYNVVAAFADNPAIELNNQGQQILITAVNQACAKSASIGFLTSGTWQGQTLLGLSAGTALPNGYLAQSQSFSAQAPADRLLRKMMPIYLCILEGQAGHSGVLQINVQR